MPHLTRLVLNIVEDLQANFENIRGLTQARAGRRGSARRWAAPRGRCRATPRQALACTLCLRVP